VVICVLADGDEQPASWAGIGSAMVVDAGGPRRQTRPALTAEMRSGEKWRGSGIAITSLRRYECGIGGLCEA
jgi:hypothetical protein